MPVPYDTNSGEDRTESPTQFRREEFRKQGKVAISRELVSILLLLGVGVSVYIAIGINVTEFRKLADHFFQISTVTLLDKGDLFRIGVQLLKSFTWMILPVFGMALVVTLSSSIAQVGFYVTTDPLVPDWNRINPVMGFQRIFSLFGSVEAIKALVKVGIAIIVLWFTLRSQVESARIWFEKDVWDLGAVTCIAMAKVFFSVVAALSAIGIVDYLFQRMQLERSMRMTRREAKEEFKLREGDPLIKSRIRSIMRRIASRRMMESVPKADVVVTNPTHLAVALQYEALKMFAPKVVAKGAGFIAEKIREIAEFHRVPIVENKPLARTLFRELEVGEFIPKELYKAVAEVLAYVYRLKRTTVAAAV